MEQTQFDIDTHPDGLEVDLLRDRIDTFNVDETKIYDFKELAIFLRDSSGQMIAGIYAYTWGGCLDIKLLWVSEDIRGRGLGSKLMQAAEREAFARGCHVAMLGTHSFQAPDFYKQLGYEEIGVLDGYPMQHKKYFLKKALSRKQRRG
ncbi:MAG TPA: GNAT family N-acetyltransferase [bacterium]|nr:GNAT family N-acetyltransferase [bacterium]